MTQKIKANFTEKLIHVLVWAFLFGSPLLLMDRSTTEFNWQMVVYRMGTPLCLFALFYLNYFLLVPKLFQNRKRWTFVLVNIGLCMALSVGLTTWEYVTRPKDMHGPSLQEILHGRETPKPRRRQMVPPELTHPGQMTPPPPREERPEREERDIMIPPIFFFMFRDLILQILCIVLAVAVRLSWQVSEAEDARREAELGKSEAELQNLRSQINPHFLLNTLNNIYALIVFDQEKAQNTVQDLSKLLRHVLYDNNQNFVSLDSEIDFLEKYIGLMKIRLSADTDITFEKDLPSQKNLQIAPLLYISLVENAFKHGIRSSEHSFIHIRLSYVDEKLRFYIENSNFPKAETDRSGSGIGLEQVQKRLDLIYPGHYTWEKGVKEGNIYYSQITIEKLSPTN